jgi:DNA invertase Pin-like site-specific DNA recombinase
MRTALYARVSTERQERYQTIDSQLAALRAWAGASGHASPTSTSSATRATAAAGSTGPASTRCATPCAAAS